MGRDLHKHTITKRKHFKALTFYQLSFWFNSLSRCALRISFGEQFICIDYKSLHTTKSLNI
jgi:hypothetical protein